MNTALFLLTVVCISQSGVSCSDVLFFLCVGSITTHFRKLYLSRSTMSRVTLISMQLLSHLRAVATQREVHLEQVKTYG
jgi:hypothetical protein